MQGGPGRHGQCTHFPGALQELIGYRAHRPDLGWVEGREPMWLLDDVTDKGPVAPQDLLPAEIEALLMKITARTCVANGSGSFFE